MPRAATPARAWCDMRGETLTLSVRMVDEVAVRRAAETAWTVYRAAHPDVDTQDSRRCLLERYLYRRREERENDTDELTSFGIAYLRELPEDEC
jgi:hypothetical protein